MKKKKFPIDTNNGETPYSNDRPVPQLSIQGKYVHPAIQRATLGVEDLKIAVSNVSSSCFPNCPKIQLLCCSKLKHCWIQQGVPCCEKLRWTDAPQAFSKKAYVFPRGVRVIFFMSKKRIAPEREIKNIFFFFCKIR